MMRFSPLIRITAVAGSGLALLCCGCHPTEQATGTEPAAGPGASNGGSAARVMAAGAPPQVQQAIAAQVQANQAINAQREAYMKQQGLDSQGRPLHK